MSSTDQENEGDSNEEPDQLVPVTSYTPPSQYRRWKDEASERNQSVSSFVATMVEKGLNDIQLEEDSPSEIRKLRSKLDEVQSDRNELRKKLDRQEQQKYHIGLGKIKDIIIDNPGIERQEIINHVSENPFIFVDQYLEKLEQTNFERKGRRWYPPNEMEESA